MSDPGEYIEPPGRGATLPQSAVRPKFDPSKPFEREVGSAVPPKFDPSRPFTKEAPQEERGVLSRLWHGMLGEDVSKVGRVGMGIADPVVGLNQLSEKMSPFSSALRHRIEGSPTADEQVAKREAGYQQREKSAGLSGGLGSEWARLLGNVVGTAPLAALSGGGGAAGAGGGLIRGTAGAIGRGAAMGAETAATMPVAGGDFATEKAKQVGLGAAGGAVLGPVAEGAGSLLGRAIAGNSPGAVDAATLRAYRTTVKPSRFGAASESQLGTQDHRILTAVDQIIANRPNLQLTDSTGNVVRGALPRTLRQFSEAVEQTKGEIFKKYDAMSRSAGDLGVQVNLAPVIKQLREVATKPQVSDLHPGLANEAEILAHNFEQRGFYSPSAAQDVIQNLNRTLQGFYRNPTHDTVSRASLLAPVASTLRTELDKAIESAQGPGYQALRQQYSGIRSVEKDIAGAVQREANKIPGSLAGTFADLAASEEAIRGVFTLNPEALLRAGGLKAAKAAVKYINDPNRAIDRLFMRRSASAGSAPPGLIRQGVGAATSAAGGPMGGIAGGAYGAQPERPQRRPSEHDITPPPGPR